MIAAHGHGAPETAAAFRNASELGAGGADLQARYSINYGLWAAAHVHGDLNAMREPAQAFLRDVKQQSHSPEAGVAHRIYGVTQWVAGDFIEGRSHLEKALAIFNPERDRDLAFRFGQDVGVSAMVYLAIALWPLGEVERARELIDAATRRIAILEHLATSTFGLMHSAMCEIIARNVDSAAPLAKALSSVAHEHGIALWIGFGAFLEAWVEFRSGSPETGLLNMRRAAALLQQDGVGAFQPLVRTALAEAEARNGEPEAALATLDQALEDFARQDSAGSMRRSTACGATSSSRKTRRIQTPRKRPFSPPSPSRNIKKPAALNCAPRSRWQNSIARPDATPTHLPSSIRRSKASRRLRNFPRSRRQENSWPLSRPVRDSDDSIVDARSRGPGSQPPIVGLGELHLSDRVSSLPTSYPVGSCDP